MSGPGLLLLGVVLLALAWALSWWARRRARRRVQEFRDRYFPGGEP